MEQGLTFITIENAFKKGGCPICNINKESEERYFWYLINENINNTSTRHKIIESMGFCNRHFWLMQRIEHEEYNLNLGTAIITESIMNILSKNLAESLNILGQGKIWDKPKTKFIKKESSLDNVLKKLSPDNDCFVCQNIQSSEGFYINTIVQNIRDEEMAVLLENTTGFCYKHLLKAISSFEGDASLLRDFLELHLRIINNINYELSEFIRKHSVQYANEPKGEEQDVHLRAIEFLAGKKIV